MKICIKYSTFKLLAAMCMLSAAPIFGTNLREIFGMKGPDVKHDDKLNQEISDWDARLEYARLLSYQHKYDESLKEYQKLLELKPDSSVIRIEMVKILYYQGKNESALQILSEIPSKEMNDDVKLIAADANTALKNYPEAESIFKAYLKHHDDDLIQFKLAELLSWEKKYDESLALYAKLLTKRPNDIQLRRKYAMVLMWQGDFAKASEELKTTLPEAP